MILQKGVKIVTVSKWKRKEQNYKDDITAIKDDLAAYETFRKSKMDEGYYKWIENGLGEKSRELDIIH